jgi:hypothetical protein
MSRLLWLLGVTYSAQCGHLAPKSRDNEFSLCVMTILYLPNDCSFLDYDKQSTSKEHYGSALLSQHSLILTIILSRLNLV